MRDARGRSSGATDDRGKGRYFTYIHECIVTRAWIRRRPKMARRTKEEALATRHSLLDAAERLFQSQGVSQTSLQDIARGRRQPRRDLLALQGQGRLFNAMMERVSLPLEAAIARARRPAPNRWRSSKDPAALTRPADTQTRRVFEVATHKVEYTHDLLGAPAPSRRCATNASPSIEGGGRARAHAQSAAHAGACRGARTACAGRRPDPELAAGSGRPSTSWRPGARPSGLTSRGWVLRVAGGRR